MVGDIVKILTEMVWGESTLEMGFLKFSMTFVLLFVAFKIWVFITTDNDKSV